MDSREGLVLAPEDLGFKVLPSQANFVFAQHPQRDATAIAAGLRTRGVLVRDFNLPRVEQYLRISIGTPAQCDTLVHALASVLSDPA